MNICLIYNFRLELLELNLSQLAKQYQSYNLIILSEFDINRLSSNWKTEFEPEGECRYCKRNKK